jgi:hypothetical protein
MKVMEVMEVMMLALPYHFPEYTVVKNVAGVTYLSLEAASLVLLWI